MFENDVKKYGTQTESGTTKGILGFENDVKKYGTQTKVDALTLNKRLRMM